MISNRAILVSLILASSIVSCSPERQIQPTVTPIQSKISGITADEYVSDFTEVSSKLRNLSVEDVQKIDFSNTPFVNIPLAKTIFDDNNRIKDGVLPEITAIKAESLMDSGDSAMESIFLERNKTDIINHDVTLDIMRLRYSDQFIYRIYVPDVGYVADANASASSVFDQTTGDLIYKDSLLLNGYEQPVTLLSGLSIDSTEPLPSLPSIFQEKRIKESNKSQGKVYWFSESYLSPEKHLVVFAGSNKFIDIKDKQQFVFEPASLKSQSMDKSAYPIKFMDQIGRMSKVIQK